MGNDITGNLLQIGVRRIKMLTFAINEPAMLQNNDRVKVELEQNLGFSVDTNLVEFRLRVFYHYPEESTTLVDITVQNVFEITDLHKYLERENFVVLPENVIVTIVGLSISHTRALLAQYLVGTLMQESLLSIINPRDIALHYFPYMFKSDTPKEVLKGEEMKSE